MKQKSGLHRAAAYCRLSKDDGTDNESAIISTPRRIITDYIRQQGWQLADEYIDDGYSGTNFDRPGFQRMIADIEAGQIDIVITKDLSRLGRNYLDCGLYLEVFFPEHNIRYISVNDGVDTQTRTATDITPFKNILNEMYAADISVKIRSARRARFASGKYMSTVAPYGYMKDPNDHNHLIVDEKTAPVVRKIFELSMEGWGTVRIRRYLNERHILRPSAQQSANGIPSFERYFEDNDDNRYIWSENSVRQILRSAVYAGNLVGYKRPTISMKSKKRPSRLPEDWAVVSDTHEGIISQEKFDLVQRMMDSRRRTHKAGYDNIFAGIVKCADCGYAMSAQSANRRKRPDIIDCVVYSCGNYDRYGTMTCSSHKIEARDLINLVLDDINYYADLVMRDERAVKALQQQLNTTTKGESKVLEREQKKLLKRLSELDKLFSALYEDKVMERITERNYEMMSQRYEAEQREIEERLQVIEAELTAKRQTDEGVEDFASVISRYRGISELTAAIVNALIERITISEPQLSADGVVEQRVRIYYKFVGPLSEAREFIPTSRYSFPIEKTCAECGTLFTASSNVAKYCLDCRQIVRERNLKSAYYRRADKRREDKRVNGTPGFTEKACQCCGTVYKPKSGNSRYCPACQALTPVQRRVRMDEVQTRI